MPKSWTAKQVFIIMEQGIITPRLSIWYGVDPLAVYNPVMESEFYGDGQHTGSVYYWGI